MEITDIAAHAATESRADFTACPSELFAAAKYLAMRVIAKGCSNPVFAAVRIEARPEGAVILSACDGDLQAAVTIAATVTAPGVTVAGAKALADTLAKLKKDRDCTLARITDAGPRRDWQGKREGPDRIEIAGRRARFALPALPVDDLPRLAPPMVGDKGPLPLSRFSMPRARFAADMTALAPCVGDDPQRPHLGGIAMQRRELAGRDRLAFVATDGQAIGIASRPLPDGAQAMADCILPGKAAAAIMHAHKLATPTDEISIAKAGNDTGFFAFTLGNVEIVARPLDASYPMWERLFADDGGLTPTDETEGPMFPDLLPSVPVTVMAKLAKAAGSEIEWNEAKHGKTGAVAGDADMLFGVHVGTQGEAPKGYSYVDEEISFTVEGDGTRYPVATKGGRIHLSAAQVAEIVGESAFETMEITRADGSKAHILKWLWDDGASRFLAVRSDGRCFDAKHGGEGALIDRAEIEAVMAGEPMPEIAAQEPQERETMPEAEQVAQEPENALSAPQEPPQGTVEDSDKVADAPAPEPVSEPYTLPGDPLADLAARVAALEARLDALPAESDATPTGAIKPKRAPAHERAIRRAWAERKARREAQREHDRQIVIGMAQLDAMRAERDEAERERLRVANLARVARDKRRRAVMLAKRHWKMRLVARQQYREAEAGELAQYNKRERFALFARKALATARKREAFERARANRNADQLARLKRDMADPSQPERESDIARLMRERDAATTALAASQARSERMEKAVSESAAAIEALAARVARAEAAMRKQAA